MTRRAKLLLLPGLLCDRRLWDAQIAALEDAADIVVADLTRDDTMAEMATRALAAVTGRFALAGLSMGGYVALEVMRQAPERVERLALLDTNAHADSPEQTARRRDLIDLANRGEFRGVSPRLLPMFLHPDRLGDEALVAAVTGMAEAVGKEAFLRQQRAIIARPDSRPDLSRLACPTLVLCGRQDLLTPVSSSEEIARAVPAAELVIIEDSGHLTTMERPEAVNDALRRWLLG